MRVESVLWIRIRIWIRIRSDPELFAGSGSGINHFGSGSGLIPNFSVKKSHFFNQIAQKIGIFSANTYICTHKICIYICKCTHICTHTHIHIHYTYTYTHMCIYICPASSGKEKTKCDRIAPSHPLSWPCVSDLLTPTSKARAD